MSVPGAIATGFQWRVTSQVGGQARATRLLPLPVLTRVAQQEARPTGLPVGRASLFRNRNRGCALRYCGAAAMHCLRAVLAAASASLRSLPFFVIASFLAAM